jgi:hypothetical protein
MRSLGGMAATTSRSCPLASRVGLYLRTPPPQRRTAHARRPPDTASHAAAAVRATEIETEIGTPERTRAWTLGAVGWASSRGGPRNSASRMPSSKEGAATAAPRVPSGQERRPGGPGQAAQVDHVRGAALQARRGPHGRRGRGRHVADQGLAAEGRGQGRRTLEVSGVSRGVSRGLGPGCWCGPEQRSAGGAALKRRLGFPPRRLGLTCTHGPASTTAYHLTSTSPGLHDCTDLCLCACARTHPTWPHLGCTACASPSSSPATAAAMSGASSSGPAPRPRRYCMGRVGTAGNSAGRLTPAVVVGWRLKCCCVVVLKCCRGMASEVWGRAVAIQHGAA